ncbi:MAG: HYR domain-containing protein, partial [Euryarchaeota archaeon]|nr:HYR domain-containing protein [Euryarchaeota archaeon]
FPPPPPPSISGPSGITVVATSPSGANVNFAVAAGSPLEGSLVPTCFPPSGSLFPVGVTTVICAVTDSLGGTAELSFTVTVLPPPDAPDTPPTIVLPPGDNLPPFLDVPPSITVPATGPAGAAVGYTAAAIDDKDGPVPVECAPASGSTFPVGETLVTCATTDSHGNVAIGGFTVTVLAGDFPPPPPPPTITVPAPMVVEATGPGGAYVDYVASASSLLDGALPTDCFPASGSLFALGTTIVGCSAIDSLGQSVRALFEIIVVDTTPPVISVPSSVSVIASGLSGAMVSYPALASDIVDVEDPVSCSPASGFSFPVGTTLVTCVSTDAHGNTAEVSFEVVVYLPPPPTILVPASMTVDAGAPNGTQVSFSATASDWTGSSLSVTCTPSSGSTFPIGTTTVTCSASDAFGRSVTGSFTVTVASVSACPWSGFLSPIKNIKPGTDAGHKTNVFDRNQLSVKFRLEGDCAAKTDPKARFYYAEMVGGALGATQPGVSSSKAVTDNFFRFKGDKPGGQERESSGTGQYVFDWDDSRVAKGQYLIWADFGDGVDRSTVIYLR